MDGDIRTKQELIKTANQIREKYRALKRGKFIIEEQRLEDLRPITEPLQKLVQDKIDKPVVQKLKALPSTPSRIPLRLETIQAPPPSLELGLTASKYLANYLKKDNITDSTYGIRSEDNNKFYIGNKNIEIAHDDITLEGQTYEGTDGLWQLLTLKDPKKYTRDDLENYKSILIKTNAHKKGYKPDGALSSNKHTKYTKIIKDLFAVTGEGFKEVSGNKIDYIYWDDPNELIDRWRLLYMSQRAGNTGVHNEIQSIIEELLERKIIYKKDVY